MPFFGFSQTKLKIISANDNNNLSFASIINLTQKTYFSANDAGEITISATEFDTIQISYVGYIKANYIFEDKQEKIIKLYQDSLQLKLVIVANCKNYKAVKINNYKENIYPDSKFGGFMMGVLGELDASNTDRKAKFSMLLKSPNPNAYIKTFTFWLKNSFLATKIAIKNPFILSIYEVDDSTKLPSSLINSKPIFYFPKKEGKQTINFDNQKIKIPTEGIYICFELIKDEKYEYTTKYTDSIGNVTITKHFGGRIEGLYTKTAKIAFYNVENGNWFSNISRADVKYEAEFIYCDE